MCTTLAQWVTVTDHGSAADSERLSTRISVRPYFEKHLVLDLARFEHTYINDKLHKTHAIIMSR